MGETRKAAESLPEWCDKGIVEQIEETISGYPVFAVEDDGVWLSGMNAHVPTEARKVGDTLERYCGCIVGLEYEDGDGYKVPVEGRVNE